MAANTLSQNITLAIKNADGSSFYNLSLKKFTVDSQVMSLGDKITGDVYYKDNNLPFTMREYVEYDGVKYTLVNPPTVVKEGMARDNSENKGMTKYSLEFYHPMYQLGNMPFNDVAVSYNESSYMSESATFSWVGYPDDYIAKLNKNLQGTQWIVVKRSNFPSAVESQISEVLPFDKESIAGALKKMYETWELPYIVEKVAQSESSYAQGKRFKVIVGMPSAEIYEQGSQDPFVFQYGQGVGLKNNSRSPRNNKIITRIAGYGSERNIPYGYPQIVWTGSTSDSRLQYPLYDGIVGGQPVKLIKHPFTRKTLMPSIYVETVNRKVNPNASGYNPNTEIIEYYDATAAENYPNPINPLAPSYETHEFEDIYPRLGSASIVGVVPSNKDAKTYVPFDQIDDVIDKYIDNSSSVPEKDFLWECKGMVITTGMEEINYDKNVGTHSFVFTLTHDDTFLYLEYKSNDLQNFKFTALRYGVAPPTPAWDDTMDDKGEYKQSYMEITLPVLGFDIYACASITEQMQINMRSGACIGCTFDVAVDWDDYKKNFFNADGDFVPDGVQRDLVKYPKSNVQSITVTAKKDLETFGTLMPNRYQQPQAGDEFVILGISLPLSYIQSAEAELADAAKAYMRENNIYYFDYPLKFDEFFLRNNDHILSQIKPNAIVHFNYAGDTKDLYIKQLTTKVGYAPLPQFDITLTDNIEVSLNQIGQTVDELGKLSDVVALLRRQTSDGLLAAVLSKLSKTDDDTANGLIRFMKGLQIGRSFSSGILGSGGIIGVDADGKTYLEVDEIYARIKAVFDNVEVKNYQHSVGNRMVTKAGIKCSRVEWVDANGEYVEQNQANLLSVVSFRCFYRAKDTDDTVNNDFVAGVNEDGKGTQDLAFCDSTNIASGVNKRSYWRAVVGKNANGTFTLDGEGWIDLSKADCRANSDIPMAGDDIIQLGNVTDKDRQGAIVEYIGGNDAPCYKIYQEIGLDERTDEEREQDPPVPFNPYVLTDKCFIDFGYSHTTKRAYMNVYGDMYVGEKGSNPSTYIRYTQPHKEWVTPEPTEEVPEPEPELVTIPAKLEIKAIIDAQSTMGGKTFQNIFQNIQDQLDGIIDNYFLEGVPTLLTPPVVSTQEHPYLNPWLTGQETPEQRAIIFNNHLGDLYYDRLTDLAYRFESSYDQETEITTYSWQPISDDAIAEALRLANKAQDTADGKRRVFSVTPFAPYDAGDLWVNVTGTFTKRDGTSVTYNNDILKCIAPIPRSGAQEGDPDIDTFNISDWSLASGYTDDTYAHGFDYLSSNLAQLSTTQIAGGLVLSSLIGLRDSNNNIQSGISGIIDTTQGGKKGGGIAAWYGGEQGDLEDTEHYPVTRFAKSLFRFDGSGYLASGNITWNANGIVTIANVYSDVNGTPVPWSGASLQYITNLSSLLPISIKDSVTYLDPQVGFKQLSILGKSVATQEWVGNNYVSKSFFSALFGALDSNGTEISINNPQVSTLIRSIKAKVGLWTESYLSALGLNDSGSGGGGIDMTVVWSALAENTNEQINKSHLTTALSGYATASWVSQNFATLASIPTKVSQLINDEGFITSAALPTKVSQLTNDEGFITSAALPTRVSQLSNDAGYITSSPLSNYLPLSGGTMTGTLVVLAGSSKFGPSLDDDTYKYYHAVYLGTHGVDHADFYEHTFNFRANGGFGTPNVYIGGNTVYHAGNLKNVSQLSNDAGYVTASIVDGYATQNWVNQNFITTSFFDELFQLYNSTTKISPNGTIPADKTNLNIKAMFGFWTERYLSALGLNDNGSSSSVGVLNDLLDVSISNPSNGQALVYNGNAWVNGNAGVDMNTVWGYLASTTSEQINASHLSTALSGYATQSWVNTQLSSYLPKTGGTVTGNLTFTSSNPLSFTATGSGTYNRGVLYVNANGVTLETPRESDSGSATILQFFIKTRGGQYAPLKAGNIYSNDNLVWHAGNLTNVSQLTNDSGFITSSGSCSYTNYLKCYFYNAFHTENRIYAYWDSSNNRYQLKEETNNYTVYVSKSGYADSAGNADTVDGLHKNDLGRCYTSSVASGKVIRISFNNSFQCIISVRRTNGSGGLILSGNGYGENQIRNTWAQLSPSSLFRWSVPATDTLSNTIEISNTEGNPANVYVLVWGTAVPTFSEQSSMYTKGGDYPIANIYSNVATATKLQTARTIWGQSFDGSGNVDGNMTVNGSVTITSNVTVGGALSVIQGLAVGANSNLSGNLTVLGTTSLNGTVSIGGDLSGTNHITGFTNLELNSTGALSDYGGYIDFHYNGSTSDYTSRIIEDASGRLNINNSLCVFNGSNVGIGTLSPSYKLHVEGVIYSSTGIFSNGYVSALGQNTSSDIRLKDIKSDIVLSIDSIANAPSVRYEWKNDSSLGMQVGSIAQYWQLVLPESVHKDNKGYLSMEYGVIALLASISTARKVQDHERRIAQLEKENERLRTELEQIKAA